MSSHNTIITWQTQYQFIHVCISMPTCFWLCMWCMYVHVVHVCVYSLSMHTCVFCGACMCIWCTYMHLWLVMHVCVYGASMHTCMYLVVHAVHACVHGACMCIWCIYAHMYVFGGACSACMCTWCMFVYMVHLWKAPEKLKAHEKHLKSEKLMKSNWKVKSTWKATEKWEANEKHTWKVKTGIIVSALKSTVVLFCAFFLWLAFFDGLECFLYFFPGWVLFF